MLADELDPENLAVPFGWVRIELWVEDVTNHEAEAVYRAAVEAANDVAPGLVYPSLDRNGMPPWMDDVLLWEALDELAGEP